MNWSAEDALKHWQKKGLLTEKKVAELKAALTSGEHFDTHGMPKAVSIFATVGAILVGLGVILFIGSNWADITPFQRIAVLFTGYAVAVAAAHLSGERGWEKTSESLWLLADIIFGANIILLAQIFHYSLTYWQGPMLWMLGTLAMGYARQHKVHAYLAVPLGILALGWLDSGSGWFFGGQFDFLGDKSNLLPILSVLGTGLVAISLLTRKTKHWSFVHAPCMSWGALLIAVPLLISTIDKSIPQEMYQMTGTVKQIVIVCSLLILAALSLWKGDMQRSETKMYYVVLSLLLAALLIQNGDDSAVGIVFEYSPLYYFLYILVILALALWAVWVGIISENEKMVNYGIVAAAIVIIVQYFSWSFELLDKSLAFILGGVLLIAMTVFIEKKRRKILSSFAS